MAQLPVTTVPEGKVTAPQSVSGSPQTVSQSGTVTALAFSPDTSFTVPTGVVGAITVTRQTASARDLPQSIIQVGTIPLTGGMTINANKPMTLHQTSLSADDEITLSITLTSGVINFPGGSADGTY